MAQREETDPLSNMDENLKAALTYLLVWVTGLVFLLIEKKNKFVRFHAMQSLITFLGLHLVVIAIGFFVFPLSGLWAIMQIMYLLMFILWIVLMVKAYQGERFKLPVVGDIAESKIYK